MSKTNNMRRKHIHRQLLMTVSAAALLGSVSLAAASDSDRPQLWIELGGQAERIYDGSATFSPPFLAETPAANLAPMAKAEQPPPYSLGLDGKISFAPEDSDWVLSAAIRYGKSSASRHTHRQTPLPYVKQYLRQYSPEYAKTDVFPQPSASQFSDGQSSFSESHVVLDFEAGKDVGLGLFGAHGSSILSAGVRFAHLTANSDITLNARPHNAVGKMNSFYFSFYASYPPPLHLEQITVKVADLSQRTYAATEVTQRDMRGVGPTMSWTASLPVAGSQSDTTLSIDWGLNAAVLFGRQRTSAHHKTTGHYYSRKGIFKYHVTGGYAHTPAPQTRIRNVVIPNIGAFAGISFNYADAKISLGYRGDFFFGAMDGGIDTRKSTTRGFYGPFANVSIGVGD